MNDAWRPGAGPEVAVARAAMLGRARDFFAARRTLEVDTPILSRYAVTDPHIESIAARTAAGATLFLQTSPEYRMKRLLAAGFGDIYQICKVFRDDEAGRHHLPEFTLVEWYRLDAGLKEMLRETIDFIAGMLQRPAWSDTASVRSYRDTFADYLKIDPHAADIDTLSRHATADAALRASLGDERDAWLDLLLADRIAPQFPLDRLTVVFHYPASQAALARRCPDDAAVADRFEVFCGALELANGFVELRDAGEQRSRFDRDRELRRRSGKPDHRADPEFLAALESGLPACAGVAVGFDRLLMLQQDAPDLAAVTHFVV